MIEIVNGNDNGNAMSEEVSIIPARSSKKSVNIHTIAAMAGTSVMTVSRVLNNKPDVAEETREKILRIIKELNYKPHAYARHLSGGKAWIIGLAFYASGSTMDGLYLEIMQGLQAGLAENGYDLLLLAPSQEGRYSEKVLQTKILDGLVMMGHLAPKEDLVELRDNGFPFLTIGRREHEGYTAPFVSPNYRKALCEMLEYAQERGAKRVSVIISFLDDPEISKQAYIQERLAGIRDGAHNCEVMLISSNKNFMDGYRYFTELDDLPEALILDSSEYSLGAVMALRDRKVQVPEHVLLIGLDHENSVIRRCEDLLGQQLPQWYVPWYTVGRHAVDVLLKLVDQDAGTEVRQYIDLPTRNV